MDVFVPIIIFVLVCILLSVCGFCCKKKREGIVYGLPGTTVSVTTQPISASPVVVPPYPVEALHPTPQTASRAPGFATHNPPYPTHNPHPIGGAPFYYPPPVGAAPYPPPVTSQAPYPPITTRAPYPPTGPPVGGTAPYSEYSQPPSYSEAVSQPPGQPPVLSKDGYSKQAPYNPDY